MTSCGTQNALRYDQNRDRSNNSRRWCLKMWCGNGALRRCGKGKGTYTLPFPFSFQCCKVFQIALRILVWWGGAFCENTLTYGNNQGFPANPGMFYENLDEKNHSKKSMFAKCQLKFAISGKFNRDLWNDTENVFRPANVGFGSLQKACQSCRSRKRMKRLALIAKFSVDTAENRPSNYDLSIYNRPPAPNGSNKQLWWDVRSLKGGPPIYRALQLPLKLGAWNLRVCRT